MRFGFMEDFRNPTKWRKPFPEFYNAILDQIVRGEELGYDNVWLTEHHFTEDGYNPSLFPTATAIAARTQRIRIGSFIVILPYQHPVRAAEDAACVDIFSNGRFDFGIGQGYSYHEWNALCMDRSTRGERTREGTEIIKKLFTEERVTFDGKYTQIKNMTLSPKSVQRPHPPIWVGARGPKAIKNAAKSGYHLMATLGPDPAPLYIETLKESGNDPTKFNIAQLRMVYVAETAEQAWEDCQEHLWHLLTFYQDILAEANDAEGDTNPLPAASAKELRHSPAADAMLIGTPDEVREKLDRFCKEFQCTDFIMDMQFPGLDPAKATRSMELFATEIMPDFK